MSEAYPSLSICNLSLIIYLNKNQSSPEIDDSPVSYQYHSLPWCLWVPWQSDRSHHTSFHQNPGLNQAGKNYICHLVFLWIDEDKFCSYSAVFQFYLQNLYQTKMKNIARSKEQNHWKVIEKPRFSLILWMYC